MTEKKSGRYPEAGPPIDHFTMVAVSPLADFSFDYQDLYLMPVKASGK